jgi:two-component system, NarL family, response regulator DesR
MDSSTKTRHTGGRWGRLSTEAGEEPDCTSSPAAIRVLVADDLHVVRAGLVTLLEREPDLTVVGEVERGDLVLPVAQRTAPDIALLDIALPGQDGLTAAADLACALPDVRVVILTQSCCPSAFRQALECGVAGYVRKGSRVEVLIDALRTVAAGGSAFDPALAVQAVRVGPSPLRSREAELLTLVGEGATVSECARAVYLAPGTVRNVLRSAVTRLQARSRVDAVRIARENGWI